MEVFICVLDMKCPMNDGGEGISNHALGKIAQKTPLITGTYPPNLNIPTHIDMGRGLLHLIRKALDGGGVGDVQGKHLDGRPQLLEGRGVVRPAHAGDDPVPGPTHELPGKLHGAK